MRSDSGDRRARRDPGEQLDAMLPQTQCTRCGFASCREYADAMAAGEAGVNRCPPGGEYTVARLAALLEVPVQPLDPTCGTHAPRRVAEVDESWCIGCTLCIQACPVDAIVGAPRRMHAVIESWCTGCELCVAPCPVDCIEMKPPRTGPADAREWLAARAAQARSRYLRRSRRLEERRARRDDGRSGDARGRRRAAIAAAVARARARRGT